MKRFLSNLNKLASLVLALVVVLLVNFISITNPFRADLSGRQYYALSDKTISLLDGLEQRVNVTVFFQEEHALYSDIENLLEEYQYQSRNIHVEWVDPARDLARTEKLAKQYGLTEAQVVVFDVDGKSKAVKQADLADIKRVKRSDPILSAFKGEQAFSSAIQGLVQGKTPKVYFLVGHGEKRVTEFDQVSGYSRIGTALVRDNLELDELLLTGERQIPEDAAALVIAGPDKVMGSAEAEMIEDYLRRSGRVMILLDALKDGGLEPMLRRWGVGLRNDFVLDPENTLKGSDVYVKSYYEHPITMRMGGSGARFHLPRSVEPLLTDSEDGGADDRPTVIELAMTSEKSWSETQVDDMAAKYDENTGDLRGAHSLAVAVERGAPQKMLDVQILPSRMVVFGDSDFISNGALTGGDQDLFMSAMNWLLDREELMAIAPKPIEEVKLSLTSKQLRDLFWVSVVGIPVIAVAGGLLVWFLRRK